MSCLTRLLPNALPSPINAEQLYVTKFFCILMRCYVLRIEHIITLGGIGNVNDTILREL